MKKILIEKLEKIPGLEDRPSTVAGGSAIFYKNKEIAHFHNNNEIDIRLTKKIIKLEKLSQPNDSNFHHHRGPSSEWIELRFKNETQVEEVVRLFKLALKQY